MIGCRFFGTPPKKILAVLLSSAGLVAVLLAILVAIVKAGDYLAIGDVEKLLLAYAPGGMTESFGPFTFLLGLYVQDEALHYPVLAGRLGPLPLPRWLLPGSIAKEHVRDGRFRFDVKILAPVTGSLLVHYRGSLDEMTDGRMAAHAQPRPQPQINGLRGADHRRRLL